MHSTTTLLFDYANDRLGFDLDPEGTLDWWLTPEEAFDDVRPVELLKTGQLTKEMIDLAVTLAHQGME